MKRKAASPTATAVSSIYHLFQSASPQETSDTSALTKVAKVGTAQAAWRAEEDALSKLPQLGSIPNDYHIVDDFLLQIEAFADWYDCQDDLLYIAEYNMGPQVVYFYDRKLKELFPGVEKSYKALAQVMTRLTFNKDPVSMLHKYLERIPRGLLEPMELYTKFACVYDSYVRYCGRMNMPVTVQEKGLAFKYISFLPQAIAEKPKKLQSPTVSQICLPVSR